MRVKTVTSLTMGLALLGLLATSCSSDSGGTPACVATNGGVEQCDNIDNDCDGLTDEDLNCGTQSCVPSNGGVEICDGVDNDCDGDVDEDVTQACVTDGHDGTQSCADGSWGACEADAATTPESCNNQDDDGDGAVDEDLQRACNTACGSGVETCVSGEWVGCDAPQPKTENCNGLDDDCDGAIDEDLERECESVCGSGTERCSLGNWVGCDAVQPTAEQCDNVDNDCDGETDEGLVKSCDATCGEGTSTCVAGDWGDCVGATPAESEVCDNGVDDDCDGDTDGDDEDCGVCVPESTNLCSVDEGICTQGVKLCDATGQWGLCERDGVSVVEPNQVPEECDGVDNDCDGATDESFETMGEVCGTDEGECVAGVWACVDGGVVCNGEIAPGEEICDGLDNDCDGFTDEELGGDLYESNETCAEAEAQWALPEGGDPLVINGTIYPANDVDDYLIKIEEGFSICNPFTGDPADDAYEVYTAIQNVPDGVDYDVCLTVAWAYDNTPAEFCDEDPLIAETCFGPEDFEDGLLVVHFAIDPTCGLDDDTHVLISVRPHSDGDFSCEPYTVTVWAETVPVE